jgi:hypothetical protein
MSKFYNAMFSAYTQGFIKHNFMTAAGIARLDGGHAPFDLHHDIFMGTHVVRLAAWSMESSEVPLLGYWVPQGDSCLISAAPGARAYVFTPDFSGCSIFVDQINRDYYRVYHVQGRVFPT